MLLQGCGNGLHAGGQRDESFGQWSVVAGEDTEQRVADLVHGRRAALPDAVDVEIEQLAADVVKSQLAFQTDALGQPRRVDCLHLDRESLRVGDLLQDGVAGGVVEEAVAIVDSEVRGVDRVSRHQPAEVGFDHIPECVVEWARGGLRGGSGENELGHLSLLGLRCCGGGRRG